MNTRFDRYFLSVILIVIGITLVLANLGIIDVGLRGLWHYVYSIFFILIGLKWLIGFIRDRSYSWVLGSFFLIFGSLLLLGQLEMIDFYFKDIYKLWPLLIVYIGFSIIGRQGKRKTAIHTLNKNKWKHKNKNYKKDFAGFTIGDYDFNTKNWKVKPMEFKNAIGDYFIDFSKAFIPEENIPVTISSWAGDIQILIPENVEFRVDATVNAGDINIVGKTSEGINRNVVYETENYEMSDRKLTLNLKIRAGSIRVDSV